jgi:hypothetical protein
LQSDRFLFLHLIGQADQLTMLGGTQKRFLPLVD